MKVQLLSVLFLVVFVQELNLGVEGTTLNLGIIDGLLEGLQNLLGPTVNDAGGSIAGLGPTVSNLVTSILGTVINLVDSLLPLVESLLVEARGCDKIVDHCTNRTKDLELVKKKTAEAVEKCRKKSDADAARISADLKKERDRGDAVISSANNSFNNCFKALFFVSCLSNAHQSAVQEIDGIVSNVQNITVRISSASDEVTKCLNEAEENGRRSADKIYQEIQKCISEAPKRG